MWGNEVIMLMREHRITQKQLAKRMGVTPQYVNSLLNGKIDRPAGKNRLIATVKFMVNEYERE